MDTFVRLNALPCAARIVTLDIPREEQDHYKYCGDSLMYDPPASLAPRFDENKILIEGTGG